MKKGFLLLLIFPAIVSSAQQVRLHLMGGFANYNGDIQQKLVTFQSAKGAVSIGGTLNITDQLAIRGDASFAKLQGDDKNNKKPQLRSRNLNFQTIIQELSLLAEYDFRNLNDHKFSPYIFGGIGLYHFSPYTFDGAGTKNYLIGLRTEGEGILPGVKEYKTKQFNFPMGGGIKYALSDDIRVGIELGFRLLRTDYLDDVSGAYVDQNVLLAAQGPKAVELAFRGDELKDNPQAYPAGGSQRGNKNANDFYYFGLFRIDFLMNWFDRDGSRADRGLKCPSKL
jgi:opacity protein-like surface antigen